MKIKSFFSFLLCVAILSLISCSKESTPEPQDQSEQEVPGNPDQPKNPEQPSDNDAVLVPNSQTLTLDNAISVVFSEGGATIVNPLEGQGVAVVNNAGHVVITSTLTDRELNYVLSGVTTNGSVKIYGNYKFNLHLNGTGITNPTGAAINIQCGKKITVTVVDKTANRLIDGTTYQTVDGEDMKATLFSEGQLNFYGKGSLEVRGKYKHAICTDGYLRIYDGDITIKEAASDAIHANDYIQIDAGRLVCKSQSDGLDCEKGYVAINGGTVEITTTGQKAHAVKSATTTTVNSTGSITAKVSGAASKGFNCTGDMTITAGTIDITCAGDAMWDTSDISSPTGIKCDGNLTINGGNITILSSGKAGKGISCDAATVIGGGVFNITTSGGKFVYGSQDASAKAIKSDGDLTINGGTFNIRTTGAEAEGMESKKTLTINNGQIEINAYDDCINASNHIAINGGNIYCYSTSNDGIDSNGTLTVTGGVVVSSGTLAPEEGFDCDQNRFTITGGVLIGTGGATSTPTSSVCTQRVLIYGGTATAGQLLHIVSSSGAEALTYKLPRTYSKMVLLFSAPSLAASTSYTIYTSGSVSGGNDFHGFYSGASYTKGSSAATFTTSSMITTVGNTSSGPGGGGRP